ncbi:MAG TPA: dienelactone hydrolase family protein [Actinobacteria bacterium]|nr:dienelactone hydrolase family protein [Actinomycetota bacterium]
MCYEPGALPPLPPIAGGAGVSSHELELTAAGGNRFAAYSAVTDTDDAPGIVILPDVRGLHGFYRELAERFTQAGVHATAFDYFGRTAGIGPRDESFEFMPHVQQTTPDGVAADVAATVAHLRSEAGGGASNVFTVGFCFGGRASFNQAARGHGLSGVIGFYGWPGEREPGDPTAPIRLAPRYECPVLGLFGGADQGIPVDVVKEFEQALADAGKDHEIHIYDGAPHSFFDRSASEHQEASTDAWRRMLAFIERGSRG